MDLLQDANSYREMEAESERSVAISGDLSFPSFMIMPNYHRVCFVIVKLSSKASCWLKARFPSLVRGLFGIFDKPFLLSSEWGTSPLISTSIPTLHRNLIVL